MKSNLVARTALAGGALAVLLPAVGAAQTADPQARIAALEQRVAELESQQQSSGPTLDMPGGMSVEIYGYAKADLFFDQDYDLGNTIFSLGSVGLPNGPEEGDFQNAIAYESRLGVNTTLPTEMGDIKTTIEGDFYGGGGGEFRLRLAYGEFMGLQAGKNWTNWMPLDSYPLTLDFQGPAGIPFAREAQVRYTFNPTDALEASFSLEDDPNDESDRFAVTAAGQYSFNDSNSVRLGAVSRSIDDEDGYGVVLSGVAGLWQGGTFVGNYIHGEGIGSYMVFPTDDVYDGNAVETDAVSLQVRQEVTDKITLSAAYGYREIGDGAVNDTEEIETIHLTATYTPVEQVTMGVEYITGERTEFDGDSYDADRVQASVQYDF
ncbi:Porin subfamily protein [Tranquillimonas rosea]|uniref:Porin subfamily protein n=1 Tax=Tranquillimonas rosea TaxID=641238 RepID=A0A1H9Q3T2_9RHOB|nr:DcaP family trimeric outer membrane transporter [Tranquillimonas rosea]SER55236.1 Porin subfamily protein [Tranquillimonas rosea]